jgi:F420H(2)-dependent quinone reductase
MPDANDWNQQTITEFRANGGRVGGPFEGAPVVLVHHRGRKSGMEYVTPMMYIPDERDDTIYVFASKGARRRIRTGITTSPRPEKGPSNAARTPTLSRSAT